MAANRRENFIYDMQEGKNFAGNAKIILFFLSFAQGGRVCYTNNCSTGPGVISLRSAGDISISQQRPIRRGLIVPQQPPNPPTIIPLKR